MSLDPHWFIVVLERGDSAPSTYTVHTTTIEDAVAEGMARYRKAIARIPNSAPVTEIRAHAIGLMTRFEEVIPQYRAIVQSVDDGRRAN